MTAINFHNATPEQLHARFDKMSRVELFDFMDKMGEDTKSFRRSPKWGRTRAMSRLKIIATLTQQEDAWNADPEKERARMRANMARHSISQ